MVPIFLSLLFGVGVYLLYDGLTRPPNETPDGGAGEAGRLERLRGMREFLVRAGLRSVTPRDFVLFSAGAGLACGLFAHVFLGWGMVSLLAAALGLAAPFAYYAHRHDRRRAATQAALVDAIAQLRDSIRTGLSVQEALVGLARSGPEALRPEFAALVRDMSFRGFQPAIGALRERLADPVFDVCAGALVLNDRLGGRNVSQVLDRLAHATRAQLLVQRELAAYQARNVTSARVVAAMPLVVLVAVRRVNPGYLAIFNDWWGQALLAACLASIALGYAAMLWLTRLPGDRRVLSDEEDAAGARGPLAWGRGRTRAAVGTAQVPGTVGTPEVGA